MDIEMMVGTQESTIKVPPGPRGSLVARVIDSLGGPVAGAGVTVCLNPAGQVPLQRLLELGVSRGWKSARKTTGSLGECVVGDVPCGLPLLVFVERDEETTQQATLIDPGPRTATITVEVRTTGEIEGVVLDARHSPVSGIAVYFGPGNLHHAETRTGPDGSFLLGHVLPFAGCLQVDSPSRAVLPVRVRPGERIDVGEVLLPDGVDVGGRIQGDGMGPFSFFSVELWRDGELVGRCTPEGSGRFHTQVAAGALLLRVTRASIVWTERPVTAPDEHVEIFLGAATGTITGKLPDRGTDSGVLGLLLFRQDDVQFLDGPEETGQRIPARAAPGFDAVEVQEGGEFTFALPPGRWALLFECGTLGCWIPGVEVRPGSVTALGELPLGSGSVAGTLTTPAETVETGAHLMLSWPGRRTFTSLLAEDGSFLQEHLPAGPWRLEIGDTEGGLVAARSFLLQASQEKRLELLLEASCGVSGTLSRGGVPFAGVELGLSSFTAATSRTTATGADGKFELSRLPPGRYALSAGWRDRGPPLRRWTLDLSPGEHRDLSSDLEARPVELRLLQAGVPVEDVVALQVTPVEGPEGERGSTRGGRRTGPGTFVVDLPPGRVLLHATLWCRDVSGTVFTLLDASAHRESTDVELPGGVLELQLDPALRQGPAPEARLAGIGGISLEEALGWAPPLPHESSSDGCLRFLCIPRGARLRLAGTTLDGEPVTQEVVISDEGTTQLAWP